MKKFMAEILKTFFFEQNYSLKYLMVCFKLMNNLFNIYFKSSILIVEKATPFYTNSIRLSTNGLTLQRCVNIRNKNVRSN